MTSNNGEDPSELKENAPPPSPVPGVRSKPNFVTTPSSSQSGPLKQKNFRDLCIPESELPSKSISDLWSKPLKKVSSPLSSNNGGRKRRGTPTRKNSIPALSPMKLVFEHCSDTDESPALMTKQSKSKVCRRSLSVPTESTFEKPKRMKLFVEETSPFEDLCGDGSARNAPGPASTSLTPAVKKLFLKSQSDSILLSTNIKNAVERIGNDPSLIGDGSKAFALPIKSNGKHPDLKEIECETLAQLLQSDDSAINFKVIDCRYPYEYEGGHIKGALNLYTKELIVKHLLDPKTSLESSKAETHTGSDNVENIEGTTREVLIFHCEFSAQRGPYLCRHLRERDRGLNLSTYPALYYPELYVLHGGYKEFFSKFPALCEPQGYVAMDDPQYSDSYRRCKSEAKFKASSLSFR